MLRKRGLPGIEPRSIGPKPIILPLYYKPKVRRGASTRHFLRKYQTICILGLYFRPCVHQAFLQEIPNLLNHGGDRTHDFLITNVLRTVVRRSSTEPRGHCAFCFQKTHKRLRAPFGNRTRVPSLEGMYSTIELTALHLLINPNNKACLMGRNRTSDSRSTT